MINESLSMAEDERLERHEYGYQFVQKQTARVWGTRLLSELREAMLDEEAERISIPPGLNHEFVSNSFKKAPHRILVLGLRGTLLPFTLYGMDADMFSDTTRRLSNLNEISLTALSNDPSTRVIILSSSSKEVMDRIVGHIPNLWISAESGYANRRPGHTEWDIEQSEVDLTWMEAVEEIFTYFVQRTPGSFVHRTETSVSWHYQNTHRDHGSIQARDLLIHLWAGPLFTAPAEVIVGSQSVEVRPVAYCKAASLEKILKEPLINAGISPKSTFTMCIGNFLHRDEDIFGVIQKWADTDVLPPPGSSTQPPTGSSHQPPLGSPPQPSPGSSPQPPPDGLSDINHEYLVEHNVPPGGGDIQPSGDVTLGVESLNISNIESLPSQCIKAKNYSDYQNKIGRTPLCRITPPGGSHIFTATVGRKHSRAQYHLIDSQDVGWLLAKLAHDLTGNHQTRSLKSSNTSSPTQPVNSSYHEGSKGVPPQINIHLKRSNSQKLERTPPNHPQKSYTT
eukprot:GHVL01043811.1.p1 GENE.GHVL01043811.1~~GHVL01043811.1.p1  ORF type:complete len:508 (+),score=112.00 GHVL01043811.1:1682-3205(+)